MLEFRKLQAVHDEYQEKQLHLVRQLTASNTTVSSSVQGSYNCRVSCFELACFQMIENVVLLLRLLVFMYKVRLYQKSVTEFRTKFLSLGIRILFF